MTPAPSVDMPQTPADLTPSVILPSDGEIEKSVDYWLGTFAPSATKEAARNLVKEVLQRATVRVPYLIPGLGVYRVDLPLMPSAESERIAALRFVAQIQQDPDADDFARELRETAEDFFEIEDPAPTAPVQKALRLVDPAS